MKLPKPHADRIIILVPKKSETTATGLIFIPEQAQERPSTGTIQAVSPNSTLKEGWTVIFAKYAGTEIDSSELGTFYILNERDILAYWD